MKRWFLVVLSAMLVVFLTACSGTRAQQRGEGLSSSGEGQSSYDALSAQPQTASSSEETEDAASSKTDSQAAGPLAQAEASVSEQEENPMKIRVASGSSAIIFQLNDSRAARELAAQLPLRVDVEDFSTNEKIFYPPEPLNPENTPAAGTGRGTLAYYAPWEDVVMFYDDFKAGGGLYELGHAVAGEGLIETLSGTIEITLEN